MCPDVLEGKIYAVKLIRRPVPRRSRRCLAYAWPLGIASEDRTKPSCRTFPVVLKYHLPEDGCNPQILITQPECKLNMGWYMMAQPQFFFIHFSEDLWTLTLEMAWYTDIHRYTQITQCYTVQHSAIQCCLHLLPTFPISKGANFWLWAAEGDHCGSWEGNWEQQVVGSSCSIRRIKPCFFDSPPDADN